MDYMKIGIIVCHRTLMNPLPQPGWTDQWITLHTAMSNQLVLHYLMISLSTEKELYPKCH